MAKRGRKPAQQREPEQRKQFTITHIQILESTFAQIAEFRTKRIIAQTEGFDDLADEYAMIVSGLYADVDKLLNFSR